MARGLPAATRRHVLQPLRWALGTLVAMGIVAGLSAVAAAEQRDAGMTGVRGSVVSVGAGTQLTVRYRHPITEQSTTASGHRQVGSARPRRGETVAFRVARDDPRELSFQAPRHEGVGWDVLIWSLPVLPFVGLGLARFVRARRVQHLVESPVPAFAMVGLIVPWGRRRRPLIHLFALDAAPDAPPVSSVRLLFTSSAPLGIELPVEVKGSPRPLGTVVAYTGDGVLWPEARATPWVKGSRRRPARTAGSRGRPYRGSRDAALLAALALVVFLLIAIAVAVVTIAHAGPAKRVQRHGLPVVATVMERFDYSVRVRYRVAGEARDRIGTAPADLPDEFRVGTRYPAHVDPGRRAHIRFDAVRFDTVEPLVWAWIWTLPPATWLVMYWQHRRRLRSLARAGHWRTLPAWILVADGTRWLIGLDGAACGSMTAAVWIVRPPALGPWPAPGPLTIDAAGVVEPGRTIALRGTGVPLEVLGRATAG